MGWGRNGTKCLYWGRMTQTVYVVETGLGSQDNDRGNMQGVGIFVSLVNIMGVNYWSLSLREFVDPENVKN